MSYVNDKLLDDIRTVGWHVLGIEGDATTPNVVHTVGLHQTFDHPEIVMLGLKMPILMQLVADIGNRVANGALLGPATELHNVLEGFTLRFAHVLDTADECFLPGAAEFYGEPSEYRRQALPTSPNERIRHQEMPSFTSVGLRSRRTRPI